jgi:tRNA(fMet)-specific endonuclease VapC
MTTWMLDTNAVSSVIRKRSVVLVERLLNVPTHLLCVSSIAYGETRFGQAQRPGSTKLAEMIAEFFSEIEVLPWTRETARMYGELRSTMKQRGKSLQPLDMLIAAHALEVGAALVTSDRAFQHVPGLRTEDWTA